MVDHSTGMQYGVCMTAQRTTRDYWWLQSAMFILQRTHPRLSHLVTPTTHIFAPRVTHCSIHRSSQWPSSHGVRKLVARAAPVAGLSESPTESSPPSPSPPHVSVLLNEILDYLKPVSLKVGSRLALASFIGSVKLASAACTTAEACILKPKTRQQLAD